jgi:uncharacterized protein involved in response to NO
MNDRLIQKNVTFAIGLAFLLYGALTFHIQDWDVGVSLVMAFFTYCSADLTVRILRNRQYKLFPVAALLTWLSVDIAYAGYWMIVDESRMMRSEQWLPSLMMYLLCGVIWTSLPTTQQFLALFHEWKDRFWSPRKEG